jgi:hypothetical protein
VEQDKFTKWPIKREKIDERKNKESKREEQKIPTKCNKEREEHALD